jgi:hypothetical protein
MWNAWRNCGPATQWGDEDIEAVYELARVWADLAYADQDRRMNQLGLTPKGKRDLRWRTPNEVKTIRKAEEKANVTKLRAVGRKEPA